MCTAELTLIPSFTDKLGFVNSYKYFMRSVILIALQGYIMVLDEEISQTIKKFQ